MVTYTAVIDERGKTMKIYQNIIETIGSTPIVKIQRMNMNGKANVYVKVESFNPGGSVKDRIAANMIKQALDRGEINQDTVIIEPTSGNTGIGLAMVCASLGMHLIIVMPDTMSVERRKLIQAYGVELVLSDGALGMKGAIQKAEALKAEYKKAFIPQQFENMDNPQAHVNSTGIEIWDDMDGKVDILVSGVGTGGTISGTGKVLKAHNSSIQIIAVEPANSAVLSTGKAGKHKIQGIGAGFVPETLDRRIVDEIITVQDEQAFECARRLAREEGILAGISSGAALYAALQVSQREENTNKNIVVILPDTGERYLSTTLFD